MHVLWDPVVRPALEIIHPQIIVEIGTEDGKTTKKILESCATWNAVLHTIDPKPLLNPEEWKKVWEDHFVFHKKRSLEVLNEIPFPDAVLIDGDHNWYTVFYELKILEERAKKENRNFPLVFLHDIAWPYARRDLYYDIDAIPAEYRRPHAKGGVLHGQQALSDNGLNACHIHALEEGTPKNGVLTAVEDFLKQTDMYLSFHVIAGYHGIGILTAKESSEPLRKFIASLAEAPFLKTQITLLETVWYDQLGIQAVWQRKNTELDEHAISLRDELASYAKDRAALVKMIEHLQEQNETLHTEIGLPHAALEKDRLLLHRILQSKSWRWTAPLRKLESILHRS